jgi:hypothetical protein
MKLHTNPPADHSEPQGTPGTSITDAARILLAGFPGLTGARVREHSDSPVIAELANAIDELNRTGAR